MDVIRRGLSRLVNTISRGRLKLGWWSCPYESEAAPIIIGGSPRSGSTLLRVILDSHPDIWIGPENGVFQEAGQNLPGMQACLDLPMPVLQALRRQSSCLGEFVDRVMARALEPQHKKTWGIKSPSVVFALETVFRAFPRARFIHTIRDGRDVVCSLRTHPEYKLVEGRQVRTGIVNPWPGCVHTWVGHTTAGLAWRGSPAYHEVYYEDMVSAPEQTVGDLLAWLKFPYDEAVWRYHERQLNEGVDSPHLGIGQPVYSSAVSRWTRDLAPDAYDAFTAEAGALLVELGYARDPVSWKSVMQTGERRRATRSPRRMTMVPGHPERATAADRSPRRR
jgi:hypothetical protein